MLVMSAFWPILSAPKTSLELIWRRRSASDSPGGLGSPRTYAVRAFDDMSQLRICYELHNRESPDCLEVNFSLRSSDLRVALQKPASERSTDNLLNGACGPGTLRRLFIHSGPQIHGAQFLATTGLEIQEQLHAIGHVVAQNHPD
jgi:hypothetical protein